MLKILIQRFKGNAASFGLISIIGGFVTDVLQPIAPFSSYIFYASTVATLIIFLTFLFKSTLREKLSNSLVLALSIMIITGTITLLQKHSDNDKKGLLANNFKVFEKFQNQLGIIETQILEVKDISIENLEETKKLSKQIEESKKELAEKIDQISPENKLDQTKMKLHYLIHFADKKISLSLQPVEKAREFYLSEDGEIYNSLGFLEELDTQTGLYQPKRIFELIEHKLPVKKFYVKYLDINSNIKGPFEIELDLVNEFKKYQKKQIKNNTNWVQFKIDENNYHLPYSWNIKPLLINRCGLKKIKIKLDDEYEFKIKGKFESVFLTSKKFMFKEVEIEMPDCTNELHNYRRLSSYAPQSYLVSSTYETDNNSLARESCKQNESTDSIFNKDCDEQYRPDIRKNTFWLISSEAEEKFIDNKKTLSKILYLLRYEEMRSSGFGPKEIKIQVEYYDGETSIYKTFKNENF
tara:strand:- start:672 stop:2072 length:1401 start_codon:yes stop_codon:yes gene_type:complete